MVFVGRKAKPISIFAYPCNNLKQRGNLCNVSACIGIGFIMALLTFGDIYSAKLKLFHIRKYLCVLWGFRWPSHHTNTTSLPLSASRYGAVTKTNYPSTELNLKITSRQGWRKVAAVGRGWFHSLSSDTAQRWNPVISEHGKLARINYGCRMTHGHFQ